MNAVYILELRNSHMLNTSRSLAIIAVGSILGLGTINANPSQAATISYDYVTEQAGPFPLKVSGSFSFDDALGSRVERELTSFTMKWEIPEAVYNFDFSDFTKVPKFDQSMTTLLGSWEAPDLADFLNIPSSGVGGTFAYGSPSFLQDSPDVSTYFDNYTNFRGNSCSKQTSDSFGNDDYVCHLIGFSPTEVRYERVGEEAISEPVPEPSSVLGSLVMGAIAVSLGFQSKRFRK